MRRVAHSSTRPPIRRFRRNRAIKRSRLLSIRCGLLMIAGGFLLVIVVEFVLHRHLTDRPDFIDKPNRSRDTVTGDGRRNRLERKASTLETEAVLPNKLPSSSIGESRKPRATPSRDGKPEDSSLDGAVLERLPPREELELRNYLGDEAIEDRLEKETKFDYDGMRVAVLVPYSGPGLPLWFDAFRTIFVSNFSRVLPSLAHH